MYKKICKIYAVFNIHLFKFTICLQIYGERWRLTALDLGIGKIHFEKRVINISFGYGNGSSEHVHEIKASQQVFTQIACEALTRNDAVISKVCAMYNFELMFEERQEFRPHYRLVR